MYCASLAASVQTEIEWVAFGFAGWIRQQAGQVPLLLSGGVILNCSINGRLAAAWDGPVAAPTAANDADVAAGTGGTSGGRSRCR